MPNVAIVGAGLIGRAWAAIFARAGWGVALWDPVETQRAAAVEQIGALLADMARNGLVSDPAAAVGIPLAFWPVPNLRTRRSKPNPLGLET